VETQQIAVSISAANFVLTWGVALYMYVANKNKATQAQIEQLETEVHQKLERHADRLSKLEGITHATPTHDDLSNIYERLTAVQKDVARLDGKLDGIDVTQRMLLAQITKKGMTP
jgi:GTP1/Obg family GTP-binding protein